MTLSIDIFDQTETLSSEEIETIENLLQFAALEERVPKDSEVSITFVTNKDIQEINRDYRGKDQPTDVISFALEETGEDEVEIQGADLPSFRGYHYLNRKSERASRRIRPLIYERARIFICSRLFAFIRL